MNKFSNISARMKLSALLFTLIFVYLGYSLHHVQIVRHEELFSKAKSRYTSVTTKVGKRGEIYDSLGNLLVGNAPCFDIIADPSEAGPDPLCRKVAEILAKHLKTDPGSIFEKLMDKEMTVKDENGVEKKVPRRFSIIQMKVPFETGESIRRELAKKVSFVAEDAVKKVPKEQKEQVRWISLRETSKRFYPNNQLLANILGFTNIDCDKVVAVIGLEKFFDQPMKSVKTVSEFERSKDGLPLVYGNANYSEVRDGLNIYLTIRAPIQAILEEELENMVEKYTPKGAYAIMADPYTGDIIAAAQRPTFNPNDRDSMSSEGWRNRIAEDTFEPGSTMKPFTVAAALDCGVVSPGTVFDCEKGRWFYAGKILRDSHPLGMLTVSEVIQKSSNIGTAKIALALGEKRVHDNLRAFGFGERTGVPLNPETSGIFRPLKKWDGLSITRFVIGQGIAASPLQLVRGYCALANGGYPVKLRLVDRIENPMTGIVRKLPAEMPPCIYKNPATHLQIVKMMEAVTEDGGTATGASVKGYDVAGKTGTSQKWVNGAYSSSQFNATFVGFVPAEKPVFVLMVTADEPHGAHYGGSVAGPYFKAISERTLKYLNVAPQHPEEIEQEEKKMMLANAKAQKSQAAAAASAKGASKTVVAKRD